MFFGKKNRKKLTETFHGNFIKFVNLSTIFCPRLSEETDLHF